MRTLMSVGQNASRRKPTLCESLDTDDDDGVMRIQTEAQCSGPWVEGALGQCHVLPVSESKFTWLPLALVH